MHTHLLLLQSLLLPRRERLGRDGGQIGVRQLLSLWVTRTSDRYELLDVLQPHHVLVQRTVLLSQRRFRLSLRATLVHITLGQRVAILAATHQHSCRHSLGTVGTLPEPAVALLLDRVQEVLAHDLRRRLRSLALLLTKHLFQLVTVPVGVRLLLFLVSRIRMDVLLRRLTSVQRKVVAVFATIALVATSRLEERTNHGLRVLTKS